VAAKAPAKGKAGDAAKGKAGTGAKGGDKAKGKAAQRAAALAALVPGAKLRLLLLDPRTGGLRQVAVAA
jgi:hypothetical protein